MTYQVFTTKEEAVSYATAKYSTDYVEDNIVNIIKIGSTMAKILGCDEGYAVDKEMDGEEE